jgi:hypothetical protein
MNDEKKEVVDWHRWFLKADPKKLSGHDLETFHALQFINCMDDPKYLDPEQYEMCAPCFYDYGDGGFDSLPDEIQAEITEAWDELNAASYANWEALLDFEEVVRGVRERLGLPNPPLREDVERIKAEDRALKRKARRLAAAAKKAAAKKAK